jgi:hypothetical protein
MTTIASSCNSTCPEPVDVTINNYTITLDGYATLAYVDSTRTGTITVDSTKTILTLSTTPVVSNNLILEIGGVPQLNGEDFTLSAEVITLSEALPEEDFDVIARYMGPAAGVSGDVSPGSILDWPLDDTIPGGWLLCDGSAISRTTYSVLFAKISTTYGAGDGSTTFNLPSQEDLVTSGGVATTMNQIIKY